MKKTRTCPKCGGKEIVWVEGTGDGNIIRVGFSSLSGIPVNRYICCSCGFTEEWVNLHHIPELKKYF